MHWYIEVGRAIKEIGIPVAAFVLLCWLVVYIVKRLAKEISDLVADNRVFFTHVREEHKQHAEHHQALMGEHEKITEQLQETAIVLGRINGYSK